MVDSNLSANFRSAETAKLSTKRVSAPDPEHPFQTRFRESPLTLSTNVSRAANPQMRFVERLLIKSVDHPATCMTKAVTAAMRPATVTENIMTRFAVSQTREWEGMNGLCMSMPPRRFGVAAWSADAHSWRVVEEIYADRRRGNASATADVALCRELQQSPAHLPCWVPGASFRRFHEVA